MGAADLKHIEELAMGCASKSGYYKRPAIFSVGLIELSISNMSLTYNASSLPQAYSLPQLKELNLTVVNIPGHLRNHFVVPNLKRLTVTALKFQPVSLIDASLDKYEAAAMFMDGLFFRSTPKLEALFVKGMLITGQLIDCLHSCPMFRILSLDRCSIEDFILSFVDSQKHDTPLPALKEIRLYHSWPKSMKMSYIGFVTHLSTTRPYVEVFGDGVFGEWS
jgi:hypothetical protein